MQLKRRDLLLATGALALNGVTNLAYAQKINSLDTKELRLGITLEPPGLDPTVSASSSISEICLYNVYETLTKITSDGKVEPLLAESWEISDDIKHYTFQLNKNALFHNGEPFNAQSVEFTLKRAGADNSTNKDKEYYTNIKRITIHTDDLISVELYQPDPDLPFKLGMGTSVMLEPKSVATNRTQPIGTGPYRLHSWRRGASLILEKWPSYREASRIAIHRAVFLFISDSYAQMASLLSGDVDLFTRAAVARSLPAFTRNPDRYQVIVSNSRAKTLMGINHRKPLLRDVRVRRALSAAIDRHVVIESAADGYGLPIGSHYTPDMQGYVDTTNINPYNPELAKQLLKEAGVKLPLHLDFILPPAPYARQGGEIISSMLARVGVELKVQNVEWAQWLSRVYTQHDYDLSIVSHVEPLDLDNYVKKDYYWGYQSAEFNTLYAQIQNTPLGQHRDELLAKAQRFLAQDAVNIWLYQPQWITVANSRIKGLWQDMPLFVNDLSALSWIVSY